MVSIALALHARGIGSVLTSVGAPFGHGQLGRPRANVQLKVIATAPSPSQVDDLQATIWQLTACEPTLAAKSLTQLELKCTDIRLGEAWAPMIK